MTIHDDWSLFIRTNTEYYICLNKLYLKGQVCGIYGHLSEEMVYHIYNYVFNS